MKITLQKLSLENFKGIKKLDIDFKDNITNISGDNATGKTTIFDAYSWLLWNKDSQNNTEFNIKTIEENGETLHNLEHSVEAEFLVKDEKLSLKKVFKEKWTKKRGATKSEFTGHTTDYFINDVPVKLKEFNERIGTLITEEQFKLLSNPFYFSTGIKKMEDKRNLVLSLINGVTDDEIIAQNKNLEPLRELLEQYTIEELLKMNKAKKTKINKELEDIPIRINERFDSKKDLDFDTLEFKKKTLQGTINKLDNDLAKQDNSSALKQLQQKIKALTIEQEDIVADIEKINRKNKRDYEISVENKKDKIKHLNKYINDVKEDRQRSSGSINEYEKEVAKLRAEWLELENNVAVSEVEEVCPTCGQSLPIENIEEQRNLIKSNKQESITEKASDLLEKIKIRESDIAGFNEIIQYKETELAYTESEKIEEPIMEVTPQRYHDITEEIIELEDKTKDFDVTDNTEIINKKAELQKELEEVDSQLAFKLVNEEADKKIAEYEAQQIKLLEEFEEVEEIIYLCEEYTKAKVDYISEDINKMFKLVKFKLFETQINGGINEICEATVSGVPFADLNNAMKINAGIDIINTLSKYYDISTPIFIDNAESVNVLEETESQVVRLVVSKDKELKVA